MSSKLLYPRISRTPNFEHFCLEKSAAYTRVNTLYILIHLVQSNQTVKLLPRGLYQKQLSKLAFWQVQPSQIGSQENGQPKQYLGPPGWEFDTLAILDRTKVETKLQLGQIFLKYYLV